MNNNASDTAVAVPTKQFFVSMLTRDISLADAILDLVDNCLDGALRRADGVEVDYSKHSVSISLSRNEFCIKDNCGGIPREIAKNYAFKMGREQGDDRDSEKETIGMYGVGMKRAVFKMGRDTTVSTLHNEDGYCVEIPAAWLEDKEWTPLPIIDATAENRLDEPGTKIEVKDLYPSVSRHFENASFVNDLQSSIGEHFTHFIQSGLTILVNEQAVQPVKVEILVSIDDVQVTITVGLNTGRSLDEDDEAENFERNRSAATAGWTVFCNDRAVIVGDKGRLTGWGDGIPLYHGQFSVITGIVEFKSASAEKLPITTTKRALDTSSEIWLEARTKMREGLRIWINHTNTWKNNPRSEQAPYWEKAQSLPLDKAVEMVFSRGVQAKTDGAIEYNPSKKRVLPLPPSKTPSSRRIVFSRPAEEIVVVSSYMFDRDDVLPGIIGDKCFETILMQIVDAGGDK
jgi:hypothetical protein